MSMERTKLENKPSLSYLETHLVDQCNLNCKGCAHFAPIAENWFAEMGEFSRDMKQLQCLFSTIQRIHLLGGEPLLHPKIEDFLFITRSSFPKSKIRIVTNGILLDVMPDSFWEACKFYSIEIEFTVYPPLLKKEKFLVEMVTRRGVKIHHFRASSFYAWMNLRGDTDPKIGFQKCRSRYNCCSLREGKLYSCWIAPYVDIFNKRFGTKIPNNDYIDIYAAGLTGFSVLQNLERYSQTCRYCSAGWKHIPKFPWSISEMQVAEWDVTKK